MYIQALKNEKNSVEGREGGVAVCKTGDKLNFLKF